MGAYLSAPVTDKDSHAGVGADFVFGGCGMQGWRKSMEDAEILLPKLSPDRRDTAMFAVFDGHGGTEVSKFCRKYMPGELQKTRPFQEGQLGKGLVEVFHRMDEMVDDGSFGAELEALRLGREEPQAMSISGTQAGGDDGEEVSSSGGAGSGGAGSGDASGDASQPAMAEPMDILKQFLAVRKQAMVSAADGDGGDGNRRPNPLMAAEGLCSLPDHRIAAGCTAVVCVKRGDKLVVANAGDSRAVLCRAGKAVPLSFDHKPNQEREVTRIRKAGGFVREANGHHRVNGNLNLSRAIGDLKYKGDKNIGRAEQIITAEPDIIEETIGPSDKFVVLACDGVWDVMSNQEVCDFVSAKLATALRSAKGKAERSEVAKRICEELVDTCLADDPRQTQGIGGDNMSAILVLLGDQAGA